jgi:predicted dinucleotide-binding enzyme
VLFYCGDDTSAKQVARQLAEELGFASAFTQARLLEPFVLLWTSMALVHGLGREFAFQLLRR